MINIGASGRVVRDTYTHPLLQDFCIATGRTLVGGRKKVLGMKPTILRQNQKN